MNFKRDFRADSELDKFALEEEAAAFPSIYMYWAEELAAAESDRDAAKAALEYEIGDVSLDIRENPPAGVKITEATVSALVAKDPRVQRASDKFQEISRTANLLKAAVRSLEHKRAMIETLRHLQIAGFYASPEGGNTTGRLSDAARAGLKHRNHSEEA